MSQKQCLPVQELPLDQEITFDDVENLDGMAYLSRVSAQAKRLPDVIVVQPPSSSSSVSQPPPPKRHKTSSTKHPSNNNHNAVVVGSAASMHYLLSHRTALTPPPKDSLPCRPREWTDQVLHDFSNLRNYLETYQELARRPRLPLPPMKDTSSWHVFCVGVNAAFHNPNGYFQDDPDEYTNDNQQQQNNDSPPETPAWKLNLPPHGYQPTASLLLQMDQVMVRTLLTHISSWIMDDGFKVNCQRGLWLFSLLAALQPPLHRDTAVTLYRLLKHLTKLRGQDSSLGTMAIYNTLIVIIGVYFEQGGGYANVMQSGGEWSETTE